MFDVSINILGKHRLYPEDLVCETEKRSIVLWEQNCHQGTLLI